MRYKKRKNWMKVHEFPKFKDKSFIIQNIEIREAHIEGQFSNSPKMSWYKKIPGYYVLPTLSRTNYNTFPVIRF